MGPIAVVGLACLFPGASTPRAFWENLLEGRDSTAELTAAQLGVEPAVFLGSAKGEPDRFYTLRSGTVQEPVFDPAGFALPTEVLAVRVPRSHPGDPANSSHPEKRKVPRE